uniref:Cadherin domain-containing protein n=1 Tax=Leptobrachium leishanense TaxID=445787 RepID=A0A8C5M2M9_9ANUR
MSQGPLDKEATPCYYLLVEVEDKGSPKRLGHLQVNVTVQDINDNPPVFSSSQYQAKVEEDAPVGSSVLKVEATDRDEGANAAIRYQLAEGTPFQIDPESGLVTIREPLDYESRRQYILSIQAKDLGNPPLTGRAEALVRLIDVNDNDPVVKFRYSRALSQYASVDENAQVGNIVALLTVTDSDSPAANGNITVTILGGNEQRHFEVHTSKVPNLSLIKVASALDRERISSYNLTISVSDQGHPRPRSSVASLVIYVNDINDHPPVFQDPYSKVEISEDLPPGSYIFGISATDGDTGLNANLRYSIVSGNSLGWFSISENSGLVTSSAALDREITSQLLLNISAQDQGPQPKTSYATLLVSLLDVNDQKPTFTGLDGSEHHWLSIPENSLTGTELVTLRALDGDLGDNGTTRFYFDADNPNQCQGLFRLDPITGRLSTRSELDREQQENCTLMVQATDLGTPPLSSTAKITVTLLDINDNSPVFYPVQYFANIQENEPPASFVALVTAADPDQGRNGTVAYSIRAGDTAKFQINTETGAISTRAALDREEKTTYQLQVVATDGGGLQSHNHAIVTITVLDTQDNPPSFTQDTYKNMRVGELVSSITATDSDTGDNADIQYSITGTNNHGTFSISPNTGSIFLAKKLDFETQALFKLNITAKDNGRPPRSSTMSVVIQVRDFNDNPPNFPEGDIFKSVTENIPVGTSVLTITASDPDADINGQLTYAIVYQKPRGNHFFIDEQRGTVYTNAEIDREFSTLFELTVRAIDQAVPVETRKYAFKNVTILVSDLNDNVPMFISQNAFAADPALAIGSVLTTVTAFDPDEGLNGEIEYEIINGDTETFSVDRYSGDLRVASPLVPSRLIYNLIVAASDLGSERKGSTTELTIILQGLDGPVFSQPRYITILKEGEPVGTNVISIEASSPRGTETVVEYFIVSVKCEGKTVGRLFTIGRSTGAIQTAAVLDRERGARLYLLDVYAVEKETTFPRTQRAEVSPHSLLLSGSNVLCIILKL